MSKAKAEGGPDGAVRITRWAGQTFLGGDCERFGCPHVFIQHDQGTPTSGGQCRGTDHYGNPCRCTKFMARKH